MLEEDVIEEVINEPTTWLSEPLYIPKSDGSVRLVLDMRCANTAIKREQYEMPNTEGIIYAANGKKAI